MQRKGTKIMRGSISLGTRFVMVLAAALIVGVATPAHAQEIKIGISQFISGPNGDYFKRELVNPAILAIEEVNAKGGLLGHKVEYVVEDNKGNAQTAQAVARKLISIDKVSMISISVTPAVLATLPLAEENHVLVMTVAQHPKITESKWGFRSSPAADKLGIAPARYAYKELKVRTIGILRENNDAIRITVGAIQKEFQSLGGRVVDIEAFSGGDEDYRGQLTKLRAANPDLLYIGSVGPRAYGLALKQAAELNFKPRFIMAQDQVVDPQVRKIAGNLVSGVYYVATTFDPKWSDAFKRHFGYDADAFAARVYDGVKIYLEAVAKAGSADPVKIRDTLANFGEFHGVTGTWGYPGTGEPEMYPVVERVK
jgi:branched-chain amino acid transport system substrate-binding protein